MLNRTMSLLGYQSFKAGDDTSDEYLDSKSDNFQRTDVVEVKAGTAPNAAEDERNERGLEYAPGQGQGPNVFKKKMRNERSGRRRSNNDNNETTTIGFNKLPRNMDTLSLYSHDDRIIIEKQKQYVFLYADLPKKIKWTVRNTREQSVWLRYLCITNASESVLNAVQSPKNCLIAANGTLEIELEIKSGLPKEYDEVVTIYFDTARIMEIANIVIKDNEADDNSAKVIGNSVIKNDRSFKQDQILRHYLLEVWKREVEVVPAEIIGSKRRFIVKHIGAYDVPDELLKLFHDSENTKSFAKRIETLRPYMAQQLAPENYANTWHTFLYLEEIELFLRYRSYDLRSAQFVKEDDFLTLKIENLSERRPNLGIGEIVRAFPLERNQSGAYIECSAGYDGIIHKIVHEKIYLKFHERFHKAYSNAQHRLEFHFTRSTLRCEHHATDHAAKLISDDFLFPKQLKVSDKLQLDVKMSRSGGTLKLGDNKMSWCNPDLNEEQRRAVHYILRGEARSMPYVIYGPPGTGKTITVVEATIQLALNLPNARIVVCAPSNSAVDLITEHLVNSKRLKGTQFVRLMGHNYSQRDIAPKSIMPYCATLDLGGEGTCKSNMTVAESGLTMHCQAEFFKERRIVIGTIGCIGALLQAEITFTHLIIDEAGQCSETQALVPIALLERNEVQVVLTGDPQQLQCVIYNRYLSASKFQISFLERVLQFEPYKKNLFKYGLFKGYNPVIMTKLICNYRSLPSIVNVFNKLFYEMDLKPMVDETQSKEIEILKRVISAIGSKKRSLKNGVYFFDIIGTNQIDDNSPSFYNLEEVNAISVTVQRLYQNGIKPHNIGVITPYSKQVKFLRQTLGELHNDLPKIGTVEEFQGQERDIIMISTVRSKPATATGEADLRNSLGFVRSPKRMNVAISRARAFMIVVGNENALSTDENWKAFIDHCIEQDSCIRRNRK